MLRELGVKRTSSGPDAAENGSPYGRKARQFHGDGKNYDCCGHGTHVAGTIAAKDDGGNDAINMVGDTEQDFVNCGEDRDGRDKDTVYYDLGRLDTGKKELREEEPLGRASSDEGPEPWSRRSGPSSCPYPPECG